MSHRVFCLPYALTSLCLATVYLVLLLPNRLSQIEWVAFNFLPLELLVLGLGLLLPGRSGRMFRGVAALALAFGFILKCADMAVFEIFARPFNPVLDIFFISNGLHLLNGAIGRSGALVLILLLSGAVTGFLVLAFFLLRRVQQPLCSSPKKSLVVLLTGLVIWCVVRATGSALASYPFYTYVSHHVLTTYRSHGELNHFQQQLESDPVMANTSAGDLFSQLKGKDVLLIFIESYGRAVVAQPEFAQHIRPLLQRGTTDLAAQGIGVRSAFLTSSTLGGLSWLAHGTTVSGLWIDSQGRYDSLVMSQRPTLNRLFKNAGWRTLAVMPAITMAWPEGDYFGYNKIYAADNLGYQGRPFNWVTMPDQYTLSAFQALERKPGHSPVMAEVALISSHAPWTPIPTMVDWDAVGDGSVFNEQATEGESPEVVWRDNSRIRLQFRKSIEYALANLISYAATYGDENLVILAVGDHQPAPLVTGASENRDVLVHLIARDARVLENVSHWRWTEGLLPGENAPVWRMDELRPRLIESFSRPTPAQQEITAR